jgi:ABC-2 type transport system permease protein/bacitracin transport system permease protein
MWTIIQTELLKLKRRKMMLGIFILTTLLAVFAIERAYSISRSSTYMDSFGDLYTLAFKNLGTVYLPIVLGMFATALI